MMIAKLLENIRTQVPEGVTLVAVSKTKPHALIQEAYQAGQRVFGENKALELAEKHEALPQDIQWHFIGHLQTNKVKYIAPFVSLIHSIDSLKVLRKVNAEAQKNNRVIPVLLQFHIARETSKHGFDYATVKELFENNVFSDLPNVSIKGIMGMATFTNDETLIRKEFKTLKEIFDKLKSSYFKNDQDFQEISMGMSGDFPIAIEEGSTMVRVGSSIFGKR